MREILTAPSLPAPKFRYSPCVKAGPFYHMAGMVALDPLSGKLVEGGTLAETKRILENVRLAAKDLGLTLHDLVTATIYTTRFQEFAEINRAWEDVFDGALPPPARTSIGVAALPLGATVEIEFRFYRP